MHPFDSLQSLCAFLAPELPSSAFASLPSTTDQPPEQLAWTALQSLADLQAPSSTHAAARALKISVNELRAKHSLAPRTAAVTVDSFVDRVAALMPRPPSEDRLRLWRSVACVAEALCLTVGRCGLELSVAASELCGSGSCSASVSELLGLVEDRVAARRCELEELLKAVAAEILEPVENWRNSVECAEDRVSEEIISKAMLPIVLKNLPSLVKVLTSEPEKRAILISKLPKDLAARCERVIRCCRSLWGRNENHVELGKAMEIARELHEFIPRNYVDDAIDQLTGSLSACPMAIIDGHYHVEATVPGATEDLTEGSAVADQDEWGQGDDEDILQYLIPPEELEARLEQSKEVDESSDVAEPRKRATRARKSVSSSLPKTTKSPSSRPRDSSTKAQETSTNTSGPSNSPKRRRNSPSSKASTPPRVTRSSRKSKATNSG